MSLPRPLTTPLACGPAPQGWPHLKPLPTSQPQLRARALLSHLDAVSAADVLASLSPYPNPHPQADVSARPPREADAFTRALRPLSYRVVRARATSAVWAVVEGLPTARVLWLENLTLPRTGFCVLF